MTYATAIDKVSSASEWLTSAIATAERIHSQNNNGVYHQIVAQWTVNRTEATLCRVWDAVEYAKDMTTEDWLAFAGRVLGWYLMAIAAVCALLIVIGTACYKAGVWCARFKPGMRVAANVAKTEGRALWATAHHVMTFVVSDACAINRQGLQSTANAPWRR